jgi:peptidoglycan/LPS O-acetylase OafA/YrhL
LREFHYAGVFATSPVSNVINGSTWSISYEFWCYIGVIVLGVSGALRSKALLSALFAFTIALAVAFSIYHWTPGGKFLHGWNRFGDFSYGTYLYAYPVQQLTMRWFGHAVPPLELFAIAAPATILCAVARPTWWRSTSSVWRMRRRARPLRRRCRPASRHKSQS